MPYRDPAGDVGAALFRSSGHRQNLFTGSIRAETARSILELRENHRTAIAAYLGRAGGNGHFLLEKLFVKPVVSVNDVKNLVGTTYPAANTLVEKFVKLGILEEVTGHIRNRKFRYSPYVNLFHNEPEDRP